MTGGYNPHHCPNLMPYHSTQQGLTLLGLFFWVKLWNHPYHHQRYSFPQLYISKSDNLQAYGKRLSWWRRPKIGVPGKWLNMPWASPIISTKLNPEKNRLFHMINEIFSEIPFIMTSCVSPNQPGISTVEVFPTRKWTAKRQPFVPTVQMAAAAASQGKVTGSTLSS